MKKKVIAKKLTKTKAATKPTRSKTKPSARRQPRRPKCHRGLGSQSLRQKRGFLWRIGGYKL